MQRKEGLSSSIVPSSTSLDLQQTQSSATLFSSMKITDSYLRPLQMARTRCCALSSSHSIDLRQPPFETTSTQPKRFLDLFSQTTINPCTYPSRSSRCSRGRRTRRKSTQVHQDDRRTREDRRDGHEGRWNEEARSQSRRVWDTRRRI